VAVAAPTQGKAVAPRKQWTLCACAGLLDDLPDGSEERKLQDLEAHVRAQGAQVKELKQQNSKVTTSLHSFSAPFTAGASVQFMQQGLKPRMFLRSGPLC
jgi:hypothetical protein